MATVHRDAETDALVQICGEGCWIGVRDTDGNGNYKNTDGTTLDYTNWDSGQPNAGSGKCVYYAGKGGALQ